MLNMEVFFSECMSLHTHRSDTEDSPVAQQCCLKFLSEIFRIEQSPGEGSILKNIL